MKARYRFNTWNYNIGGPIYIPGKFNRDRQKLFFFWSHELWPLTVPQALTTGTVPNELERKGDFSQSFDTNNRLIVVRDPDTRQAFPGNMIPANRLNSNGAALLNMFPKPNVLRSQISGGNYNYAFQSVQKSPTNSETAKLDYNLSPKDLFAFTFTRRLFGQEGMVQGTRWPQYLENQVNEGWIYILRHQRIFTPTLINEATISFSTRPLYNPPDPASLKANQRETVGFNLGQLYPANNPLGFVPNATFGGVPNPAQMNLDGRTPLDTRINFSCSPII